VICRAERVTGQVWPEDLKAWLEVQGGRVEAEMAKSALFPVAFMPLGAPAIAAEWRSLVDLWADQADSEVFSEATRNQAGDFAQVWIPQFVPVASEVFGSHLLVDLSGGPLHGCVCEWDGDQGWQEVRWPSVAVMLDELLAGLESDRLGSYPGGPG